MKLCTKCKVTKLDEYFYISKNKLSCQCKECQRADRKARYTTDPTKELAYAKSRYRSSEDIRAKTNDWGKLHPEKREAYNKKWSDKNPEKSKSGINARSARRKASKIKATPVWANTEFENFAIKEIYDLAVLRSKMTGIKHHVDHIVPLRSEIVQGLHCVANLQVLEEKLNLIKSNLTWPNMPGVEQG